MAASSVGSAGATLGRESSGGALGSEMLAAPFVSMLSYWLVCNLTSPCILGGPEGTGGCRKIRNLQASKFVSSSSSGRSCSVGVGSDSVSSSASGRSCSVGEAQGLSFPTRLCMRKGDAIGVDADDVAAKH